MGLPRALQVRGTHEYLRSEVDTTSKPEGRFMTHVRRYSDTSSPQTPFHIAIDRTTGVPTSGTSKQLQLLSLSVAIGHLC